MSNEIEIEHAEIASQDSSSTTLPIQASGMRISPEQLAAAQRTREYHVRKLRSEAMTAEHSSDIEVDLEALDEGTMHDTGTPIAEFPCPAMSPALQQE